MNMEAFNKLPKDLQEVVLNAAKEFEARRMVQAEKDQAANEQRLADYGITIVPLSDEELNNIAKKVRAEVWPEIKKDLGEEWADSVLKNIVE
jgi:TRAP-type C4-dicarboxylate transport system substrate-binding protein